MRHTPILLSLQATSTHDGEPDEAIQLLTSGELIPLEGGYQIDYQEQLDETTPPTQVRLSMQNGAVSIVRQGDYETNMIFCQGQRFETQYHSPMGVMDMAIYCTKVHYSVRTQGGEVQLQYQLDLNGQYTSMHQLEMRFAVKDHAQ